MHGAENLNLILHIKERTNSKEVQIKKFLKLLFVTLFRGQSSLKNIENFTQKHFYQNYFFYPQMHSKKYPEKFFLICDSDGYTYNFIKQCLPNKKFLFFFYCTSPAAPSSRNQTQVCTTKLLSQPLFLMFYFEIKSHYFMQVTLKLVIFLPQPKCFDYWHTHRTWLLRLFSVTFLNCSCLLIISLILKPTQDFHSFITNFCSNCSIIRKQIFFEYMSPEVMSYIFQHCILITANNWLLTENVNTCHIWTDPYACSAL